ncbi:MAG: ketopantoate reductase family protein [Lachnospiraceae bacterium]|nr:ketopantoate reductase family protein [Lachnospiraceae bacterium]
MKIENVDIVGLGALGTMYADFFTKKLGKEHVRILSDGKRAEKYIEKGNYFNGKRCDFQYVNVSKEERASELLIVAVKYGALPGAIREVKHLINDNTVIISVLNGIQSEHDLAEAFGEEKIIYCIAQKMDALKEGNKASCKNKGELALGVMHGGKVENLKRITDLFDELKFPYVCPENMQKAMWSKLLCNVGVNQTVTFYEGTYATVQKRGEARNMMKAAMEEVVLVANAEGVKLTKKDVKEWVSIIDSLNPDGEPSMRQDSKADRPTEVALFAGTICRLAREHGIDVPVNEKFLHTLK